jgi:hypothetical protein
VLNKERKLQASNEMRMRLHRTGSLIELRGAKSTLQPLPSDTAVPSSKRLPSDAGQLRSQVRACKDECNTCTHKREVVANRVAI